MSQDEIRDILNEYLRYNPGTIVHLAHEIGVSYQTLNTFLKGGVVRVKTWKILNEYVKSMANKND